MVALGAKFVCCLRAVGEGEARAEGRRGDLTSGREVLSSRELSGGCQARQVRGARPRRPPPRPGRPARCPRPRGPESRREKSVRDAGGAEMGVGARGQLGKFLFRCRAGEGASSWRVRLWVCELGCVCESRLRSAGGSLVSPREEVRSGPFGGPSSLGSHSGSGPPVPRTGVSARGAGLFGFKSARC